MSLDEYHARQRANVSMNQQSVSSSDAAVRQHKVREISAHVEKAIALLGDDVDAGAKAELKHALEKLAAIRR